MDSGVQILAAISLLTHEEVLMNSLRMLIPTYNGAVYPDGLDKTEVEDFGNPYVPVLVQPDSGLRIFLGSHAEGPDVPDVAIERRPHGWAIFLHPVGGSDPSGYIYFLDDGRSYLVPESGLGATPEIQVVKDLDKAIGLDGDAEESCAG